MAAAGYTPILLYASGTASNVPLAGNLTSTATGAELAINYADGKLFYKDSGGVVQLLASKDSAANSFSGGTTGLTPNTATQGAVTLGGTLATTNGGTGLTAFTANQVFYASSTSAFSQSTNLQFNGTTLTLANDASIHGLTVGQGLTATGNCVAIGQSALQANTANSNTAIGYQSLYTTTTGYCNVGIGQESLKLTNGIYSVAVGFQAGASSTGSNNTFIGNTAGSISTGSANTFIGCNSSTQGAGVAMTTGSNNVIIGGFTGNNSGLDIHTSNNYIVLSDGSGNPRLFCDGSGNFSLNSSASGFAQLGVNGSSTSNPVIRGDSPAAYTGSNFYSISATASGTGWTHFIGKSSSGGATNILIYGNGDIQNANNSYGAISDEKLKENIVDATPKLADLMNVKIRNYNLIGDELKQIGVVAQELQEVFPSLVDSTPDKDADDNDLGTETLSVKYSVLVPIMIKAMQEQQAIIESLTTRIAALESK